MKIVTDVNILIAALIKDSKIRKAIQESINDYYFPEISFHKLIKYKPYIIKKANIREEEYTILLVKLFSHIKLISREEMLENREEARKIMSLIDKEDVPIVAAALSLGNEAVIWSDDTHFNKQNHIKILKTRDVIKL